MFNGTQRSVVCKELSFDLCDFFLVHRLYIDPYNNLMQQDSNHPRFQIRFGVISQQTNKQFSFHKQSIQSLTSEISTLEVYLPSGHKKGPYSYPHVC